VIHLSLLASVAYKASPMVGLRLILALATGVLLGACAATPRNTGDVLAQSPIAKSIKTNWYIASEEPLTLFPKGCPVEAPTTPNDGEWVYPGDNKEIRWFVPREGVASSSRDELHKQATDASVALQVLAAKKGPMRLTREIGLKLMASLLLGIVEADYETQKDLWEDTLDENL